MGDLSIGLQRKTICHSYNMGAAKMLFKVRTIDEQDTTVDTVVMFDPMVTAWVIFQLDYSGKLIVTFITWMLPLHG